MKLLNKPNYNFTTEEEEKMRLVLRELAADIETVAGISFNNALASLSRKKV